MPKCCAALNACAAVKHCRLIWPSVPTLAELLPAWHYPTAWAALGLALPPLIDLSDAAALAPQSRLPFVAVPAILGHALPLAAIVFA